MPLKLSVGVTYHADLPEIKGLFTQGSRPGRTVGESVGGILEMYGSDWSNGTRHHILDTTPDTEFNATKEGVKMRWMTWRAISASRPRPPRAPASVFHIRISCPGFNSPTACRFPTSTSAILPETPPTRA